MYYDKRIRYIDYLENGEKRRNCGYVKITVTDGGLLMEMQIRGLYETDDVASEVMLEGAGTESRIGTVMIRQGNGSFRWESCDPVHVGEEIVISEGLKYGQLKGIAVQLSPRRSLHCIWRETEQVQGVMPESAAEAAAPEGLPERAAGAATQEELPESAAGVVAPEDLSESAESVADEAQEIPVTTGVHEEAGGHPQEELHTAETRRGSIQESYAAAMCEDKWQQLQMIYPHIYPFQDEREYLSLRPEDFVILSHNAYRLVRNSFLLHGYYNYEHLILTCVSYKGTGQYYIGVPGNFYEKEKQVAIMYGFNSFECKQEPAEEGDFGYYMIRVEL